MSIRCATMGYTFTEMQLHAVRARVSVETAWGASAKAAVQALRRDAEEVRVVSRDSSCNCRKDRRCTRREVCVEVCLRADPMRNHLALAGTASDLKSMCDAIAVFDVDWMRGQSFALHPLTTSKPGDVAHELETIFAADGGAGSKLVRFIPNERLNAVLVLAARLAYLERAPHADCSSAAWHSGPNSPPNSV